ncbi:Radical SAM superfamily enzyme YgiQ, UPF0313 family [Natronincola peptidivorans]|uniref:Radical SAM superfamily enzyme YgiQ, UPF0313 family n=1 Tax=Natronincola peptidivorans TaxID=426128 RepID=A0A1I0EYP7_9FIRM|nr:B12-binding domain-containing radical SAM protein [Natronincola peptidivorans]SET50615.1 Radical SAM superfamily enzyme YgiQ, UPF0313 family [Natronincola peptidivorans]
MKVLLTGINAKYIHSNLAIRYLSNSIKSFVENIQIKEFTINHSQEYIMNEIYKIQPDVVCFSCYIWNIQIVHQISRLLKKVMPQITIVLGGPEVSFETVKVMEINDAIDIVVIGEGEITLSKLIYALNNDEDYSSIRSLAFRARGRVFINEECISPIEMQELIFPYKNEVLSQDKIIYYESSRGCPFNCQYCLSSTFQGVRFRPIEMVKEELKYLIDQEVRQVKFVDRTFNAKKQYAIDVLQFILKHSKGKTNFHFEITADLLDEDMLDLLKKAPAGLFQFEIGIQSTNSETLQAIQRDKDFAKIRDVVTKISSGKNIHQHLDLIVGLPKEDYFSFRKSFDDVFALRPEKLQVGFLKLLKGSGIRKKALEYNYIYDDRPPYEVLENDAISYGEIMVLKGIEEMVETFWNTRMFSSSIEVVITNYYSSPFRFFEELWFYWEEEGYHHQYHSRNKLYQILLNFYLNKSFENNEVFKEVLKFDFLKYNKTSTLPDFFSSCKDIKFKEKCHRFLQQPNNLQRYLPQYIDLPAKQIIKKVHFEQFQYNMLELENNPSALKHIEKCKVVLLYDYDIESKAIEHCKYYLLKTIEFSEEPII